jgi:hypothetical protein
MNNDGKDENLFRGRFILHLFPSAFEKSGLFKTDEQQGVSPKQIPACSCSTTQHCLSRPWIQHHPTLID